MAEHYIRMAKSCKDQTVATKLHEMSKDELRHYDFCILNWRKCTMRD